MRITATFLDEVTCDIPSNNWGREEWAQDFRIMKAIGIDTVVMIRAGLRNVATFPSKVLDREVGILPVYTDLVDMFLDLAEENGMDFYFGTYDSCKHRLEGNFQKETDINMALVDEVWAKYGRRKAFKGWYLSYEIAKWNKGSVDFLHNLSKYCKQVSGNIPVMISPYLHGLKQFNDPITPEEHRKDWNDILDVLEGSVDIVAFQDGHVDFDVLPEYLNINSELISAHQMQYWSNLETFDRDQPFDFPPIEWQKLWWKLTDAEAAGATKVITFEFSHFLSPNSCWPSAKNLFNRYCEHFGIKLPNVLSHQRTQHRITSTRPIKILDKGIRSKTIKA